jgi:hypothetical protein
MSSQGTPPVGARRIFLFVFLDSPNISVLESENCELIARFAKQLFKKQPSALYFEKDNSKNVTKTS